MKRALDLVRVGDHRDDVTSKNIVTMDFEPLFMQMINDAERLETEQPEKTFAMNKRVAIDHVTKMEAEIRKYKTRLMML
jgi:hypothetical protein